MEMKKTFAAIILGTFLSAPVLAQNGGFVGPGSEAPAGQGITTVQQAKTLPDDSKITLEGQIVRKIDNEHYEFRDTSGSLTVEIDNDKWQGLTVTPKDTVRLEGEVDKDHNKVEIDVKRITRR
ncbi:TIGR00156 family protein [Salmonella enterica subsp. enterica serovar Choleraesuis]|nr:TIGR00156 family protein [Salmonella enterica subsp. enterica serovar Choleraesuis]